MGEVYRARDSKLKRDVAIKLLPEEFSRDPERVSRFQREAEALAALNHPNIAGIYDVQQSGSIRFLVLEFVEGDTLADVLKKRGALPVDEALYIAKQICEALEAAHDKGIVHRDLKPANIKVMVEGKVKVLDFGILVARRFDLTRRELQGEAVTVADSVAFDSNGNVGAFSVSAAGLVAYRAGATLRSQLTWFDRGSPTSIAVRRRSRTGSL